MSWRLWIWQGDGLDGELVAEVEGGGVERETAEVDPEVELIAGAAATEAVEEVPADVNREATWVA